MSYYALLWLEGPLQAWGYDSKFSLRLTLDFPTRSGILGLLFSAMGAGGPQEELLAKFKGLTQIVYSYSHIDIDPSKMVDYQVVGNGYNTEGWESRMIPKKRDGGTSVGGGSKLTYRHYLQDAAFAVVLEIPDYLADCIEESLKNPIWPIFLGRRTCIPSAPVFCGVYDSQEEAESARLERSDGYIENFKVIEGNFPDDGDVMILNDVPVLFGEHKKYESRYVTKILKNAE